MRTETAAKAPGLHARRSNPQDTPFLRSLFASRCDHLRALDLPPTALQQLIDQQYACREADYQRRFPTACTLVALVRDERVGSVVVHDDDTHLHIVDLTVAAAARGQGHGRALVRLVQSQAQATGRAEVSLQVDPFNAIALRLYQAQGFHVADKQPFQWRMRWHPHPDCPQEDERAQNCLPLTTPQKG